MSVRPKFLYMLVLALMVVSLLFVAYGMLDLWREQLLQRKAIADLAARMIEENIRETGSLKTAVPAAEKELSHLGFFSSWLISDTELNTLSSFSTNPEQQTLLRSAAMDVLSTGKPRITGLTLTAPLTVDGSTQGFLWARLERRRYLATFPPKPIQSLIIIMILAMSFIMLIIYMSVSTRLLRPIERLAEGARRVARGDYSSPVRSPGARGEVDKLIDSFNNMVAEIRELRTGLETRVDQSAREVIDKERQLAQAQRLAAIGHLASEVAHEINNPLGGMMNALRKLAEDSLSDEKKQEYMGLIQEGLDSIAQTVRKLLHFAPRPSAPGPFQIEHAVSSAITLVQHYSRERNVTIERDTASGGVLNGNEGEIKQVLVNLLMNAIDASPEGKISVTMQNSNSLISIRITDNGRGMTPQEIENAFEPFHTTKEHGQGSGLGLPITADIVKRHSGSIRIESEPDRGTTVTVELPASTGDNNA